MFSSPQPAQETVPTAVIFDWTKAAFDFTKNQENQAQTAAVKNENEKFSSSESSFEDFQDPAEVT